MENYSYDERKDIEFIQKIRSDPWEFSKYVFTKDESDKQNPIKRFPYHLAYVKFYFRVLEKETSILVPKSRRMKISWTTLVFMLWDTMFHAGRHNAVVSKKEDDADWLIKERLKFMYENLDPRIPRDLIPKAEYKYNHLTFPEIHSYLQGFPQGEHQLRMYTLSNIFADEFAFWDQAEGTYSGARPTLEGGGRFIGVSSAAPGFFKRAVFDNLDNDGMVGEIQEASRDRANPLQGIQMWKNKKNKFTIVKIHYTADPNKRSPEFKESAMQGISRKRFNQEYEIAWETYEGVPVYTDFSAKFHVSKRKLEPWLGLPLLRGWDFGLTPACVVCQMQEGTLVVLKEFTAVNMGIQRFAPMVMEQCQQLFPSWPSQAKDYLDFIDPAGFNRTETDETTCAQVMGSLGLKPKPGDVTWTKRQGAVEEFLTTVYKGNPAFLMNGLECPILLNGFEGGYRYPDSAVELEPNKIRPMKDVHSHPHDALQMVASKIKMINRQLKRQVPRLGYSFTKGERKWQTPNRRR